MTTAINFKTTPLNFSDHHCLSFSLQFSSGFSSLWKLSSSILADTEYQNLIDTRISLRASGPPGLSTNLPGMLPLIVLTFVPGGTWGRCVLGTSISHIEVKELKFVARSKLLLLLKFGRRNGSPHSSLFTEGVASLLLFAEDQHSGAHVRSGQQLAEALEQPTSFFYWMEKIPQQQKSISSKRVIDSESSDPNVITSHIVSFYRKLFTKKVTDRASVADQLYFTTAKLSTEQREALD